MKRMPSYAPRAAELWAQGMSADRILDILTEEQGCMVSFSAFGDCRVRHRDLFPVRDEAGRRSNISETMRARGKAVGPRNTTKASYG